MARVSEVQRATVDDLYQNSGKAELVNGELMLLPPTGATPGQAATEILVSLHAHAKPTGRRRAAAMRYIDRAGPFGRHRIEARLPKAEGVDESRC
jgi:hypothetical protein